MYLFSFKNLNFETFSFRSEPEILAIPVRRKKRRLHLFQAVVENRGTDQPFGLLGMVIRYRTKNKIRQT